VNPLRVLWCETYDDGTIGGSHTCMFNLASRLDPDRFKVTAAFYSPNLYVERYTAAGIETIILPGPIDRRPSLLGRMRRSLSSRFLLPWAVRRALAVRRIGLVVLNNSVFASAPFIEAGAARGIPMVAYERGTGIPRPKQLPSLAATARLAASLPVSQSVREHIVRIGFKTPRIEVIYDGIDPNVQPTRPAEAVRAELGLRRNDRVIGMVGNVRAWKGQHVFVDAFFQLAEKRPDVHGLIVGAWSDADREYHADLVRKIAERGLERRLRFLGYREDVRDLLNTMDVMVHASTSPEPWGMVLLEAMAARRPVVATAMGGPLEILDNGRCGLLVPPGDAKAMAHAVDRYLSDAPFRDEMVTRARARVESMYDIRQTVAHTSELFAQVAGAR